LIQGKKNELNRGEEDEEQPGRDDKREEEEEEVSSSSRSLTEKASKEGVRTV